MRSCSCWSPTQATQQLHGQSTGGVRAQGTQPSLVVPPFGVTRLRGEELDDSLGLPLRFLAAPLRSRRSAWRMPLGGWFLRSKRSSWCTPWEPAFVANSSEPFDGTGAAGPRPFWKAAELWS